MKVGLALPIGYGLTPRNQLELALSAERAGLTSVSVAELTSSDALALVGAIAAVTDRIELDTAVVSIYARSMAAYAMAAATLHDLSAGRFTLGLGPGSPTVAHFHGASFDGPTSRMHDFVTSIQAALRGESLRNHGNFRLRGIVAHRVPIRIAAMQPKMIQLAGEMADGLIVNFAGPERCAELHRLATARRYDADSTHASDAFETYATVWIYTGSAPQHAARRFAAELAPYVSVPSYRRAFTLLAGHIEVARLAAAYEKGGRSAAGDAFPAAIVDAMLWRGDDAELAERIAAYHVAGCSGIRFIPLVDTPGDLPAYRRVIEQLGELSRLTASIDPTPS